MEMINRMLEIMENKEYIMMEKLDKKYPCYKITTNKGGVIKMLYDDKFWHKKYYEIAFFAPRKDNPIAYYKIKSNSEYFKILNQVYKIIKDIEEINNLKFF